MQLRRRGAAIGLALFAMALGASAGAADKKPSDPLRERGRYLTIIAGCNDCHTPGYAMSGGKVDEKQWLIGDALGWRGPWGTTYPVNLRLYMEQISEKEWIEQAKTLETRPPMPWFALRDMSDEDLAAIYAFIHSLGPSAARIPAFAPPGTRVTTAVVKFPERRE